MDKFNVSSNNANPVFLGALATPPVFMSFLSPIEAEQNLTKPIRFVPGHFGEIKDRKRQRCPGATKKAELLAT